MICVVCPFIPILLPTLDPKLRYMRQVALPQLLLVNMVIDIDCLSAHITSQLLDELARHTRPAEVRRKPVAAAMG
jgi:hypothetical protein